MKEASTQSEIISSEGSLWIECLSHNYSHDKKVSTNLISSVPGMHWKNCFATFKEFTMSTLQACIILIISLETVQIEAVEKDYFQAMLRNIHEWKVFKSFSPRFRY